MDNRSNRRDFLKGEAARRAAESLLFDFSPALPASTLIHFSQQAMACEFAVFLNRQEAQFAAEPALQALDLVDRLEAQLTVYREHSEVSQLNRTAALGAVPVEPRLYDLLRRSLELSEATKGAFDITAGPLSKTWGFYRRQGAIPDKEALEATLQHVGWRKIRLESTSIAFDSPGVEINLGAIGKGYALDRCANLLRERGVNDFLMHGGQSSVIASGKRNDARNGWPIALRHPLQSGSRLGDILLTDEALGTSGSGNQFFRSKGRRLGHILDPRTGQPVEGVLSATVVTPSAADADALATALFVMGYEAACGFCEQHPDVRALFVLPVAGSDRKTEIKTIGEFPWTPRSESTTTREDLAE